MAKTGSGKVIQMLSPENYIRKKARSIPIHECHVNGDWEKSKMANVIVSRRHTNGNITACFYLVDLMLLGVKDTDYMFNRPFTEYKERTAEFNERFELIPVSYQLAHNIIFSGVEFADEYGFTPHKDFTSITSFMLEEDDDKIELIEVECGYDGKPAFISSPVQSKTESNKIITRLEKNAGPGNFIIFDEYDPED